MYINWYRRVTFGLFLAIPLALLTYLAASADGLTQDAAPPPEACGDCHEVTQEAWEASAHSKSLSDPIFQAWWFERGRPSECLACHTTGFNAAAETWAADGVTCEMCHQPVASNHPDQIMPTDVSSRLCGNCHLDTHTMWQDSGHAAEDLSCINCHNPHTTDIRKADAQTLCSTCHQQTANTYHDTFHAEAGLLCTDCHLQVYEAEVPGEGHARRSHTFTIGMETCAACHETEMHAASSTQENPCPAGQELIMVAAEDGETQTSVPTCVQLQTATFMPDIAGQVDHSPGDINPSWFAVIAALVGMGTGIVVAPWLDSWSKKPRREENESQS
jgi:predicted CXXCH cytochrome family protein